MVDPRHSIVIPLFNEEDCVDPLYESIRDVATRLIGGYEVIFVNDGSTDQTERRIRRLLQRENAPHLVLVTLERNYGMSEALQAGFQLARGGIILTLDADLQNDPRDIVPVLEKLNEGYDAVFGWRRERKDPAARRVYSSLAAIIRRKLLGDSIHDVGCGLRAFRREALDGIVLSRGLHRFLSILVVKAGHSVAEVPVRHFPRRFGRSKSGLWGRLVSGSLCLVQIRFGSKGKAGPVLPRTAPRIKEIVHAGV